MGTYTVQIIDANGCQVSQTGSIVEPTPIVISTNAITNAACFNSTDGGIDISVSGGTPGYL
ncbi:MAG: hypothetical protein IPG07_18160 [Crocinitomicaceae bacterium]|nr:hypothetical protein [Crocinitomicaceae bacterium]